MASRAPFPPNPLCQVMDCFLKPNWKSLWPGRGPSPGCRSLSKWGLGTQVASLRWAVPWPEGPTEADVPLLRPRTAAEASTPLKETDTVTQGTPAPSVEGQAHALGHTGPEAALRAGSQAGPALSSQPCVQVNNKPLEMCTESVSDAPDRSHVLVGRSWAPGALKTSEMGREPPALTHVSHRDHPRPGPVRA